MSEEKEGDLKSLAGTVSALVSPKQRETFSIVSIPSIEEIYQISPSELHKRFQANHALLLQKIEKAPYFGLHGLPMERLLSVLQRRELKGGDMLSFFPEHRTDPEGLLYALYSAARYTALFSNKDEQPTGGICIIDLSSEDGRRNIAHTEHEAKGMGGMMSWHSSEDTDTERMGWAGNNDPEKCLHRAWIFLDKNTFNKRMRGFVDASTLNPYLQRIGSIDQSRMSGNDLYVSRFLAQLVVSQVLAFLVDDHPSP